MHERLSIELRTSSIELRVGKWEVHGRLSIELGVSSLELREG